MSDDCYCHALRRLKFLETSHTCIYLHKIDNTLSTGMITSVLDYNLNIYKCIYLFETKITE